MNSPRDDNRIAGLIAKSDADNTPVTVEADPATRRLKTNTTVTGTVAIDTAGLALAANQLPNNHNVVVTSAPTTAVTGTFWQATQPVSGSVTANTNLVPTATTLNTYSVRLTTNATTTPTASTAYISSLVITAEVAGTTSTVTVRDKQGTPIVLVNGLTTTAASLSPTVLNFQTPVKMISGFDIITAGAVAATVDVFVNYYG